MSPCDGVGFEVNVDGSGSLVGSTGGSGPYDGGGSEASPCDGGVREVSSWNADGSGSSADDPGWGMYAGALG